MAEVSPADTQTAVFADKVRLGFVCKPRLKRRRH